MSSYLRRVQKMLSVLYFAQGARWSQEKRLDRDDASDETLSLLRLVLSESAMVLGYRLVKKRVKVARGAHA